MTNPFNQTRFRQEAQLGKSYQDVRKVVQYIEEIKLLADNIEKYRSGNIELKMEGTVLYWKYQLENSWNILGDLTELLSETTTNIANIQEAVGLINGTLDNHNSLLTQAGSAITEIEDRLTPLETTSTDHTTELGNISGDVATLQGKVEDMELFDTRIHSVEQLIPRLNDAENTIGNHTSSISAIESRLTPLEALEARIEALENAGTEP